MSGKVDLSFIVGTGFNASVASLAIQPNGQIIVGGQFTSYNGDVQCPNNLARINPDGTLDTTFNYGAGTRGFNGFSAAISSIAIQFDGKILAGGEFTSYNGDTQCPDGLVRINPDGTLDTSFNYGSAGFAGPGSVRAIVIQPNGKILAGGAFISYNGDAQCPGNFARVNSDGTLDTSFNYGVSGNINGVINALILLPNGKILVGGGFNSYNGDTNCPDGLARVNSNGTLDTSFNYGAAGFSGPVRALALHLNGQIITGGEFSSYNGDAQCPDDLARINSDGTLDTLFNYGAGTRGFDGFGVNAVIIQPDGKVIAGGPFTSYNGDSQCPDRVARLNFDGTLDDTFNYGAGRGLNITSNVLVIQPNGRLVVGGVAFTSYNDGVPRSSTRIIRLIAYSKVSFSKEENFGARNTVNVYSLQTTDTFKLPITNDPGQKAGSISMDPLGSSLKIRKPDGNLGSITIT